MTEMLRRIGSTIWESSGVRSCKVEQALTFDLSA
jgi:hypothetical protein